MSDFFNLSKLRALYKQLHNKPEGGLFGTVGEVIKHRDNLIAIDEKKASDFWQMDTARSVHLGRLSRQSASGNAEAIQRWSRVREDEREFWNMQSGKRMADINAIQAFLHRCGLSV